MAETPGKQTLNVVSGVMKSAHKHLKLSTASDGHREFNTFPASGPTPAGSTEQTQAAGAAAKLLLDSLCSRELCNLASPTEPVQPPVTADQIAAWVSASDAIRALAASSVDGGQRAKLLATRAIAAADLALEPLLQSDDSHLAQGELPAPESMRAMSLLATQAAVWAGEDDTVAAAVLEGILHCAEQCTALGAEVGPSEPAGQYSLQLALAAARNLKVLMRELAVGCGPGLTTDDIAARMHILLMVTARLAEMEWSSAPGSEVSHESKALELWGWSLVQGPVDDDSFFKEEFPAQSLARVWTEASAVLLGAAWRSKPPEARSAFLPLASGTSENECMLLLLGRLLVVIGGEEAASQLFIPVVTDTLAARVGDLDAGVYAVAAHVLAAMAVACANSDNRWGYSHVVDVLVKLYKFPLFSISAALMHGTPTLSVAQTNAPSQRSAASHKASRTISGRCPGALARALTWLAEGLDMAPIRYRKDLRQRMLSLYSDFFLLLPNESYVRDLGALLPAVAAAMHGLQDHSQDLQRSSMALSSGELSLETLSSIQEEGLALVAALRYLWLQSSVYDFASLRAASGHRAAGSSWPSQWGSALSVIAASTPVLLLGSEQQKAEAFLENAVAEYGNWLTKLDARGEGEWLMRQLVAAVGAPPAAALLPAPLAAHILVIAYKAACHASFQGARHATDCCPLAAVIIHMQYSVESAAEYPWMKQTLTAVLNTHMRRLSLLEAGADAGDAAYASLAVEATAKVLIASQVSVGPNEDVAQTARRMLEKFSAHFPALMFSAPLLYAALQAVADQETRGARSLGAALPVSSQVHQQAALARSAIRELARRAASIAPGPAEAIVVEAVRTLGDQGSKHSIMAMQFAPELMQALQAGRAECPLPDMTGTFKGLVAWSVKVHSLGMMDGLVAAEADITQVEVKVVARCTRELLDAVRDGATDKILVARIAEAAAAAVQDEAARAVPSLLRLLAWVPLSRFTPEVMSAATMVWHWLLAVTGPDTRMLLLEEIASAWQASRAQGLGVFSTADSASSDSDEDLTRLEAIKAHHAWVVFWTEVWLSHHFDALKCGPALYTVFSSVLDCSLSGIDDDVLTLHPAAVGARFRFLQLALSFVYASLHPRKRLPLAAAPLDIHQKVVQTGLAWFAAPVAWYEGDAAACREAAAAVRDFARCLAEGPSLVAAPQQEDTARALYAAMESPATKLLQSLLASEIERLEVWAVPSGAPTRAATSPSPEEWSRLVSVAWQQSPHLAFALGTRFAGTPAVTGTLQQLVKRHAAEAAVQSCAEGVRHLATPEATAANAPELAHLASWEPVSLQQAMSTIASPAGRHPTVRTFLLRSMLMCDPEHVAFFLPQLVQLLRHDPDGAIENFLLDAATRSVYFAYLLVCQLASEGTPPAEAFNPSVKRSGWTPPSDTGLWSIADRVQQRLWETLHGPVREHLEAELKFFADITEVSGKLYPVPKEERKAAAVGFLNEISLPRDDLFMPTDLHAKIMAVKPETAAPMQSAAKCPILVAFDVERDRPGGYGVQPAVEAAIFKVGDDCRQDVLALQVISLLKEQFDAAALPLPLVPYGVIPTGHECGIIEVVPHAKSRAQLGELCDGGLFEVFQREFGLPGSARFEAARAAFIASSAAYAVASYLLQAKDRHNGNIMIDNRGRIIHIDFGYILGISPGGNMGFESAAFKLSYEMTELLDPGSTRTSPHFLRFQNLCVKGYLVARSVAECIVAAVAMSEASKLPCFGRGTPVESLRERFHLEMSDAQAAEFMQGLIVDAYDKWTTGVYDLIQYYQNRIPK